MIQRIGIIPARYGSTRFPGKPLALIGGVSMIERVYRQASKAKLDLVVVATDDERILEAVEKFGGKAVMSSTDIGTGTERCRAVLKTLGISKGMVVNIQGDEPFIEPEHIDQVLQLLEKPEVYIATLVSPALSAKEVKDPNRVKVVLDRQNRGLYFSRLPIPYHRESGQKKALEPGQYFIHLGIYGFKTQTFLELETLNPSPLELAENLEQLRWRENGYHIYTAITESRADAVDTPEDLEALQKKFFL